MFLTHIEGLILPYVVLFGYCVVGVFRINVEN
jgi:hypothetical protein